jgi:hypothetical protein
MSSPLCQTPPGNEATHGALQPGSRQKHNTHDTLQNNGSAFGNTLSGDKATHGTLQSDGRHRRPCIKARKPRMKATQGALQGDGREPPYPTSKKSRPCERIIDDRHL